MRSVANIADILAAVSRSKIWLRFDDFAGTNQISAAPIAWMKDTTDLFSGIVKSEGGQVAYYITVEAVPGKTCWQWVVWHRSNLFRTRDGYCDLAHDAQRASVDAILDLERFDH